MDPLKSMRKDAYQKFYHFLAWSGLCLSLAENPFYKAMFARSVFKRVTVNIAIIPIM